MTHDLNIDLETYSSVNLGKCGLYKYAQSPDFAVLLFGYSLDGGPVEVIDLAGGDKLPEWLAAAPYGRRLPQARLQRRLRVVLPQPVPGAGAAGFPVGGTRCSTGSTSVIRRG